MEGPTLSAELTTLISNLFARIPVPVAVVDDEGNSVFSNPAFTELFGSIDLRAIPTREIEILGRGTFVLETAEFDVPNLKIVYAREITNEVVLRNQVVHLEKMAAIGRLVSGVAHELNNPLAGILGYAELAAASDLNPSTRRMVEVILAQAERAGKIVRNFLTLAAKNAPKRVAFDVNEIVRNVIELRGYGHNVGDIIITTNLTEDLPKPWGDPHQIEQVLLNLIVNAEHGITGAGRQPGTIQIGTASDEGRIRIVVSDNGAGIRPADMEHIFDPFFTTKETGHGTGLGLSICSEIVKNHGGDLFAWSTYGSGATFTLELPIRRRSESLDIEPPRASRGQMLHDKQILVIDDEAQITELIFDVLARQGAKVDLASSGAEALKHIKTNDYDLVVCDQLMPGLSGQRLYRQVRSVKPALEHRFLFVTGDVINAKTKRFFEETGLQCLQKPFRIQDLLEAVGGMINRNQPQNS